MVTMVNFCCRTITIVPFFPCESEILLSFLSLIFFLLSSPTLLFLPVCNLLSLPPSLLSPYPIHTFRFSFFPHLTECQSAPPPSDRPACSQNKLRIPSVGPNLTHDSCSSLSSRYYSIYPLFFFPQPPFRASLPPSVCEVTAGPCSVPLCSAASPEEHVPTCNGTLRVRRGPCAKCNTTAVEGFLCDRDFKVAPPNQSSKRNMAELITDVTLGIRYTVYG